MKYFDIAGLIGFSGSGILFVISALRAGDPFALAGSFVWLISCLVWMVGLLRSPKS